MNFKSAIRMCGIAGIFSFQNNLTPLNNHLVDALETLKKRGPDAQQIWQNEQVGLGHARLSIIDTSAGANQPFVDDTENYIIIFNGEIFNYLELKEKYLSGKGTVFKTTSDTEVLLQLYINYGAECLNWLNGFFALAIYNKSKQELFVARDRMGKKPLHFYKNENQFCFASEMKALLKLNIPKEIDHTSLYQYLQLNYIPQPFSIFKNVHKLPAGCFLKVSKTDFSIHQFYETEKKRNEKINYADAQTELVNLVDKATQRRLISDVPLGAFLSGGIDSSVVVGLASRYKSGIHTFSVGYKDEPFFDETKYAELVAKKFNTQHTVFKLSNDDLFENLFSMLDYIDEPFADSSAIAVNILSKLTHQHVTVALSGDGADEIFGGYNKYTAEYQMLQGGWKNNSIKLLAPLWRALPKSRNNSITNKFRQLNRFAEGAALSADERHWRWCCLMNEADAKSLFPAANQPEIQNQFYARKKETLKHISLTNTDINNNLLTDTNLVLQGDMLVKVDLMSMANSLEVRSPFLDFTVVDFAFSLPSSFKIDGQMKKKIVQDAFRTILPPELYNRPKHGFEVPLLKWFRNELKSLINDDLLKDEFILEQNIFDLATIQHLKKKLFSNNPGDVQGNIWALIVFQYWWKKYFL